jgi:hypothetical protein
MLSAGSALSAKKKANKPSQGNGHVTTACSAVTTGLVPLDSGDYGTEDNFEKVRTA